MIDAELRAFLHTGLGIHIGTRNTLLEPNGARAAALSVQEDGVHLVVYVAECAAGRVLPDLESNGQAAVVVARPSDDRSCQLKGVFAGVRPAAPDERAVIDKQWQAFLTELDQIGIPRVIFHHWTTWPALAIRIRTTAVFEQTPGPAAGTPREVHS